MVLQYKPEDIIKVLALFCKNESVPEEVCRFIAENTQMYGSARLFMENDTYFLDIEEEAYQKLRERINIQQHLEQQELSELQQGQILKDNRELLDLQDELESREEEELRQSSQRRALQPTSQLMEVENERRKVFLRFKIVGDHFIVSEGVINVNIPLIHEFDFENEANCHKKDELQISFNSNIKTR